MLIRCKYCDKDDVFEDECKCSNEEARKKFDYLEEQIRDYRNRELDTVSACKTLIQSGVRHDIIEKFWDSIKKADVAYADWLDRDIRKLSIIVSVLHLVCPKARCGVKQADDSYKLQTTRECLQDLINHFSVGREGKDKENYPIVSVDELIASIK